MALSVECPAEWDRLAFLGADRLDAPRRRRSDGCWCAGKSAAVFGRAIACSTARRKPVSSSIEVSSVFDPLVVDDGGRERVGETVSPADAFLGTRQNARACAVPRVHRMSVG
jgi:hypothetical protein